MGRDAFLGDTVVGGDEDDRSARQSRDRRSRDPSDLTDQRLEVAEAAGRFGEVQLSRARGTHRGIDERFDRADR